jgi:hypothetical protein
MIKVIWAFRLSNRGWTETYYYAGTDLSAARLAHDDEVINRRLRMCSPPVVLQSIVFQAQDGSRASRLKTIERPGFGVAGLDNQPDNPTTAALVRFRTPGNNIRSLWVRGLRDVETRWSDNLISLPQGTLREYLQGWITQCINFYDIRYVRPVANTVDFAILAVQPHQANPFWTDLVFAGPEHGFLASQLIRVTRVPQIQAPGLSGVYTAEAVAAEKVTVAYRLPSGAATPLLRPGHARQVEYASARIAGGSFLRFSTRDTGRPTGAPRGRKLAARRLP